MPNDIKDAPSECGIHHVAKWREPPHRRSYNGRMRDDAQILGSGTGDMRSALAAVAATPDAAAPGLPGRFYTCPEWFDWECETLLHQGWYAVGRADELAAPGDYLTTTLLGEPVVILRDDSGTIRAFANSCRHRGMPLVSGAGSAKRLVCPYHAWTYGLDGGLLRAARMVNDGFNPSTCRLPEFAVCLRYGFIYLSIAESPAPMPVMPALDAMLDRYEPDSFRIVHSAEETWSCNWKMLVENFMEGYHLSVVHPQTLHGYTPTGLSKKGPSGPGFTSYFANYPDHADPRGGGAPGLTAEETRRSSLFSIFPGQVASQAASLLVSLSIIPVKVDEIRVRWTMSTYGDTLDAPTIAARIALWNEVNREDREKLEAMQSALHSRFADGGYLAGPDYEGTVRDFHHWLAAEDARM